MKQIKKSVRFNRYALEYDGTVCYYTIKKVPLLPSDIRTSRKRSTDKMQYAYYLTCAQ